jgi:hypothetical protein
VFLGRLRRVADHHQLLTVALAGGSRASRPGVPALAAVVTPVVVAMGIPAEVTGADHRDAVPISSRRC